MRRSVTFGAIASMVATVAMPVMVLAAPQTVVVTPAHLQGWQEYPGTGEPAFVTDPSSPLPPGALQFDTPNPSDEVQMYRDLTPTAINQITKMSYSAKRLDGATYASPAYVLGINPNDGSTNEIYAWYEPVYNQPATTNYNDWQTFNLDTTTTKFWSFDTIDATHGGANGANLFTLSDVAAKYPNAKVIDLTLNVGSGTPGWSVRADNVTFNDTTWNFEVTNVPTDKNDCKNGGYASLTDANGKAFKNQGDCVSYVVSNKGGKNSTTTTTTTNTTITNTSNISVSNTNSQNANGGSAKSNGNTNNGKANGGNASNSNSSSSTITVTNGLPLPTF